jgi:hypothetical protein
VSNAVFYRSALAREITPEMRALFQSCFSRAEQIDEIGEALPAQFAANRARREGKPSALTKSARRTIRSFAKDSEKAAAELPALVAALPNAALLVRTALESERTALLLDQAVYIGGHGEDEELARPLLELRAKNIAELEAFLSASRNSAV